jgi:hypothetical protein
MMTTTQRNRVFIADFSAKRARLGKAKMMRVGGSSAADDAGLRSDEFAVLLVAQTNRFADDVAACERSFFGRRFSGIRDRRSGPSDGDSRGFCVRRVCAASPVAYVAGRLRSRHVRGIGNVHRRAARRLAKRNEPRLKGGLDKLGVILGQRVLGRETLERPVGRLIRRFELVEYGDQTIRRSCNAAD